MVRAYGEQNVEVSRYSQDNDNSPEPHRVFPEFVRASDICERNSFANFELRPTRLKQSV
jgi:prophage DNA circulation protein